MKNEITIKSIQKLKCELTSNEFENIRSQIDTIFWQTSGRSTFSSDYERQSFYNGYLGYYLENYGHLFLVAFANKSSHTSETPSKKFTVAGYICGAFGDKASKEASLFHPYLKAFQFAYEKYPAHLHINLCSKERGRGTGSLLLKEFENRLQEFSVRGVHLITLENAKNVSFYEKNGYMPIRTHNESSATLLCMGKTLPPKENMEIPRVEMTSVDTGTAVDEVM